MNAIRRAFLYLIGRRDCPACKADRGVGPKPSPWGRARRGCYYCDFVVPR